jgi:hypothetical protein
MKKQEKLENDTYKVTEVSARVRAYRGDPIKLHNMVITRHGTVLVYDDSAGYFTGCHGLSQATQARIRRLVKESV